MGASLDGPWSTDWDSLGSIVPSTSNHTFNVPMFYRVIQGTSTGLHTVVEVFTDENGQHNLVDVPNTTALYDSSVDRYLATQSGPSDSTEVTVMSWGTGNTPWTLKKSFAVSGSVARVSNQIKSAGNGHTAECKIKFMYSDGTNFETPSQTQINSTYTTKTYSNDNFGSHTVTNIEVWLRGTTIYTSTTAYERNTALSDVYQPAAVDILNPSSAGNIVQTYLDITSVREPYDAISYELTDGITTNSYASFATWYPVTNALTNPTRIRVLLTPASTNVTEGGTGLISVDFRMKKQ